MTTRPSFFALLGRYAKPSIAGFLLFLVPVAVVVHFAPQVWASVSSTGSPLAVPEISNGFSLDGSAAAPKKDPSRGIEPVATESQEVEIRLNDWNYTAIPRSQVGR
jgi:hypothetical protein